ncbi:hypothetical protein [Fulvivirga imtechensis]|uniref:hypothetical protein n=1 Tax=Fulvivirga imtechensis TaxID=881893 RepID=UPI00058C4469|nr:hypothetical protein [Fulvivirga imtechensis]
MKNLAKTILILVILSSCNPSRYIFKKNRFEEFERLSLQEAVQYEKQIKSKDTTPGHLIRIGEGIYPNAKQFNLSTPRTYQRLEGDLLHEVEYFYNSEDNSVKVILYEWVDCDNNNINKQLFNEKFRYLQNKLTDKLGTPSDVEINSPNSETTFLDGIKWTENNNPKAYLFMLGNNKTNYRKIRLAIYIE